MEGPISQRVLGRMGKRLETTNYAYRQDTEQSHEAHRDFPTHFPPRGGGKSVENERCEEVQQTKYIAFFFGIGSSDRHQEDSDLRIPMGSR